MKVIGRDERREGGNEERSKGKRKRGGERGKRERGVKYIER